ncbi:MAG TPA: DPP IV N-terminal domain-containing protein [Vicinamibacterales bacterium]|nr:DPP IV N-terminal domain-containing protein [Vicinamibacterales bacterium]
MANPRWAWFGLLAALPLSLAAQDRLRTMPGYESFQRVENEGPLVRGGTLAASWVDANTIEYSQRGKHYLFDVTARRAKEAESAEQGSGERARPAPPATELPERGRQFTTATSPDARLQARYRDRNVWLGPANGGDERAVTTDGSTASRVKYGTASWAYGEELEQHSAMWWSPDSRKLAFYRFDESRVADYYVTLGQTRRQTTVDVEAFPTAGAPNPVADLYIYDVVSGQTTRVDVRSGRPFDNSVVGHYVYHVGWSRDGRELIFFRTNRRQNVFELAAADPATGVTRTILREEWPTGWVNEDPRIVFLEDGRRFIWESQRNGWNNFYLYDLGGQLIAPLTSATNVEAATLVKIDERAGLLFYTARDGDSVLKQQLHRVGLDGKNDRRLTDPAFHHRIGGCIASLGVRFGQPTSTLPCGIAPDNRHFIDIYQTHDTPPATRLVNVDDGSTVSILAESDTTRMSALQSKKAELFTYKAADGKTELHGLIQFPSTFDPSKTYPALVRVYGAPEFANDTSRESFVAPSALTEFGFLLLTVDSRSVPGLGKRTLDAVYQKLGQVDVDDMTEGVKALWNRPYLDKARIGIFGSSYGGYTALMGLLRHPEVFAAASVSSPVSDWRNYDSIYTERYMGLPEDNKSGYDAGNALNYASRLNGRLLLYYGTADNNVHPSNTLQLIDALQGVGKSFDVQVGPDRGHSEVNEDRMMEFFIDVLGTARSR